MKRLISIITVFVMLVCALPICSNAYNVGDVIGEAVETDIVATINGYAIPSYNVEGYTYIVVEDLRNYGFTVGYSDANRELSVCFFADENYTPEEYEKPYVEESRIGQHAYSILYTDIRTVINWEPVNSFNIDGNTIIRFDELRRYGEVSYDDNKREISLNIEGHTRNKNEKPRAKAEVLTTMTSKEKRDVNLFLSKYIKKYYGIEYETTEENDSMFSIATSMKAMNDGSFTVVFDIYADPDGECGDVSAEKSVYSLSPAKAAAEYDYRGYGTAIIREKTYNGNKTYELVDYKVSHGF